MERKCPPIVLDLTSCPKNFLELLVQSQQLTSTGYLRSYPLGIDDFNIAFRGLLAKYIILECEGVVLVH